MSQLWNKNFISIIVINFLFFSSFQMLIPVLPVYAESLGATDVQIGLLGATLTVSSLIMRMISGVALDEIGRRPIFLGGLVCYLLIVFFFGFIKSFWILIALRFLQGFGWGAASTSSTTIASDIIPRHRFGEGMGYFSLSTALAIAIAPALGLQLFHLFGFPITTFSATALTLIVLVMALQLPIKSPEKRVKQEGEKRQVFERNAIRPAIMIFFISATMAAITNFVALYGYELGVDRVPLFFLIYAIFMIISRPLSGVVVDRRGFKPIIIASFLLMMSSLLVLWHASDLLSFVLAAALFGSGFAGAQTSFQTMAVTLSPRHRVGSANATFFIGFDAGIGFGAIIAGVLAQSFGYSGMYLAFLGILSLAFLMYFLLGWEVRDERVL